MQLRLMVLFCSFIIFQPSFGSPRLVQEIVDANQRGLDLDARELEIAGFQGHAREVLREIVLAADIRGGVKEELEREMAIEALALARELEGEIRIVRERQVARTIERGLLFRRLEKKEEKNKEERKKARRAQQHSGCALS